VKVLQAFSSEKLHLYPLYHDLQELIFRAVQDKIISVVIYC